MYNAVIVVGDKVIVRQTVGKLIPMRNPDIDKVYGFTTSEGCLPEVNNYNPSFGQAVIWNFISGDLVIIEYLGDHLKKLGHQEIVTKDV